MRDAVPGLGKRYEAERRVVRKRRAKISCEGEVRCEGKVIVKAGLKRAITAPKAIVEQRRLCFRFSLPILL